MNSNYKCLIFLVVLFSAFCQFSFSQGFKVKEFKQNLNDGTAFHAPMDAEGHPCGLIKVRTNDPDLQFKGDIVGNVENKMNEYWVYVPQSSRQIKVNHPNFMPFVVSFSDYGVEVSPKATYVLTLEEIKYKKEKTGVTIIVKPENADLYIDDVYVDNLSGHGYYQLYLPKGEHVCKISKTGYRPNVQIVQTGKATQNISVELESVMAELEVKCKTETAEIFVDEELKGNGSWKGLILAGKHQVEARQTNYITHKQTIDLEEKNTRLITIPVLKRSIGKILIETIPNKVPVTFDGKDIGISPCSLECETGPHYIAINAYGCIPYRKDVEVVSGGEQKITIKLNFDTDDKWLADNYKKAYKEDLEAIDCIIDHYYGQIYRGGSSHPDKDSKEAVYWLERHPHPDEWLAFDGWIKIYCNIGNPEKAMQLYPSIKQKAKDRGYMFSDDLEMMYIGDAFLEKKEYDKAIQCLEKAGKYGYEGLGDCYLAKGDKQRAASYYKKCLNLDYYDGKNRVEKKLKELRN